MRIQRTLLALFLIGAVTSGVHAAEFGAKAYSMGGAFTGLSDNFSALMYNPAALGHSLFEVGVGLGSNDSASITKFGSLLSDPRSFSQDASVNLSTLSGVLLGRFGAGLAAEGNLDVSTTCSAAELCASGDYTTQIVVGYGMDAASLPFDLAGVDAGFSVKRLDGRRIDFEMDAPSGGTYDTRTNEWLGHGYSISLGARFMASDVMTVGLSASDILSSMTWNGTRTVRTYDAGSDEQQSATPTSLGSERESLRPVFRGGVAVHPPLLGLTVTADIASDGSLRYGLDKQLLLNALSLRAGQIQNNGTTTTTAGLGANLGPVHIDAAFGSDDGFKTTNTTIEGSVRF